MDQLNHISGVLLDWLLWFSVSGTAFLSRADVFARARMTELGWSAGTQTTVEVVGGALLVLFLLRVFAPILRLLLILLLLILALQLVVPARMRHAAAAQEAACASWT